MSRLLKLTWVEVKLFLREPVAVIFSFAFPFFVLFVLVGVFGTELDTSDEEEVRVWRGVSPADYYVPAYVGMVMAAVGLISLPLHLAGYRERGVLRRFRAAGVPAYLVVGSQVGVSLGVQAIGGVAVTASSTLIYGTSLPDLWLGTAAAWMLGALTFAAIGVFLGVAVPTARAAQSVGLVLFFVMMFISGAGPPREVLTGSMRAASDVLPLTHVILAIQEPWLGFGWHTGASLATGLFLAAAAALTAVRLRWD